jgi:hypothetical protein
MSNINLRYCGVKLPPMLTSQGNMMTVVLSQLESNSEFELSYVTIKSSTREKNKNTY